MHAFGHAAVGEFGHDDGAVDEHPDGEDEAEQHHDVHGQAERGDDQDSRQEGSRDGQAHEAGAADAEGADDHDHHQKHGGGDVVLKIREHVPDLHGLVLDEGDLHRLGPLRGLRLREPAHVLDGVDDVLAEPLLDLQRDRRLAVEARVGPGVLEGPSHRGDVPDRDHGVPLDHDGQGQDVVQRLEKAGHLDGKLAVPGVERAGGDQPVVARDGFQQRPVADVVAFEAQRVDDDLEDLVAVAGDVGVQDSGKPFEIVAEASGEPQQRAFGNVSGQHDDEHGEQADVDLVHARLLRVRGQFALGRVHAFPDVPQGGVGVEPGLELEQHRGVALAGVGAHFPDALDGPQLLFHGPHQEPLRVLRRDAFVGHRDVDDGNVDVGIRFLGNADIRGRSADQDQRQRQQHHA